MRWFLRIFALLFIVPVVVFGGIQIASESGEVVVLTTADADGGTIETRLWVVEYEGYQYLRSGDPAAGWYQRLLTAPQVEVVRGGRSAMYTAISTSKNVETINRLMAEKYGWADAYVGAILGKDNAVAVRLEPLIAE